MKVLVGRFAKDFVGPLSVCNLLRAQCKHFQLESAYNTSDPAFDGMQMEEERRRMREHVVKEVDKNGDSLVSLEEFLTYTNTEQFVSPEEDSYKVSTKCFLASLR